MLAEKVIHSAPVQLDKVRSFVASHGNDAWIENGSVHFTSWVGQPTPVAGVFHWYKEITVVHTIAQARRALGY